MLSTLTASHQAALAFRVIACAVAALVVGSTDASAQFSFGQKPKVDVAIRHPAGMNVALKGKKVAFGQISGPCATQFSDLLIPIFQANGVEVINREHLTSILAEHKFQISGSVDSTTAVELGRVLGPSVMIFVTVTRCSVEHKSLYEKQFVGPPVNVSRTEGHFLASIHTVDLATGRELAVKSVQADPVQANRGTTGIPEFPGEVQVQDEGIHQAVIKTQRLFFDWTENRPVPFMNSKECNLKSAYDTLRAGDIQAALKVSKENVDACKAEKPNRQADALYNLGITEYLADDFDAALQAMNEANKLHSDRTILDALNGIRKAKADLQTIAANESQNAVDSDRKRAEDEARQKASESATLTNADVIEMVKSGLPPELIIHKIGVTPARFSVGTPDLLTLKRANVPDAVINAMLDKK